MVDRSSHYPHHHQHHHLQGHSHHTPVLTPNTYTLNLVGTLGLSLVIGVLIYDFLAYLFAVYRNQTDSYSPYGRRIATLASDLWERKSIFSGINPYLKARSDFNVTKGSKGFSRIVYISCDIPSDLHSVLTFYLSYLPVTKFIYKVNI